MNKLQEAVIEQLGYDELDDECLSTLEDVTNHGADSGFVGFTYYSDTEAFFADSKEDIIAELRDYVEEMGYDSMISLVNSFKCARDSDEDEIGATLYSNEHDTYVANCLAWFALEEVARQLTDV